jgi:cell division protein FtsI/penicillin-binding protein 2
MMVEAAKKGEAKWTHEKGFKVAGKTGTAQIPIEGHYDEEKTIASFVGFAPYDDPKFIMLVTLHEPSSSPWASETAAPLWYSIAKNLFPYFGIHPEN